MAEREHQNQLVLLEDGEARVGASVIGDEPNTGGWPSGFTKPLVGELEVPCDLGLPPSNRGGDPLRQDFEDQLELGQKASIAQATRSPAAAAATPFLVESFVRTRTMYEVREPSVWLDMLEYSLSIPPRGGGVRNRASKPDRDQLSCRDQTDAERVNDAAERRRAEYASRERDEPVQRGLLPMMEPLVVLIPRGATVLLEASSFASAACSQPSTASPVRSRRQGRGPNDLPSASRRGALILGCRPYCKYAPALR